MTFGGHKTCCHNDRDHNICGKPAVRFTAEYWEDADGKEGWVMGFCEDHPPEPGVDDGPSFSWHEIPAEDVEAWVALLHVDAL